MAGRFEKEMLHAKIKRQKVESKESGASQSWRNPKGARIFSLYGRLVHIVNFLCLRVNLFNLLQLKNENDEESEISNFSDSDEEEFNRKPPASKLRTYVSRFPL